MALWGVRVWSSTSREQGVGKEEPVVWAGGSMGLTMKDHACCLEESGFGESSERLDLSGGWLEPALQLFRDTEDVK